MLRRTLALACVASATSLFVPTLARATEEGQPAKETPPPPPPPPTSTVTADKPIVVWPTLTPAGDDVGSIALHKPATTEGPVYARAQELDATLRDAVQDLGYTLDVADPGPTMGHARDLDLLDRAKHSSGHAGPQDPGTWVVSARLEPISGDLFLLRIVVVPQRGKQLRVRVERVSGADVAVRGLVLLRDLLSSAPQGASETGPKPQESASSGIMSPLRSQGRAVLAANAALFGAFAAFSIQRASGSEDPRLLYPLLTLGTGLGLGSALLVAEEFDVSTGAAWSLAGGAWWGTASGILIANGRHVQPLTDRYAWGVGGGLLGLGLTTFALTRSKFDEGDAVLVNSGAGIGLGLGALANFLYTGDLDKTPYTGAGYGTAIGLVAGGTLATFLQVSPSRVLLIDLGAGLGAAAGAAAGSPLVFEEVTPGKTRGFVIATASGTLLGGAVAWWFTRGPSTPSPKPAAARIVPYGGIVGGTSMTVHGPAVVRDMSGYGLGLRGTF
jgi:hypothetical protein